MAISELGLKNDASLADWLIPHLETLLSTNQSKQTLLPWLIVAKALADRSEQEIDTLLELTGSDLDLLRNANRHLDAILQSSALDNHASLLNAKLSVADLALKTELSETNRTEWMGYWAEAMQGLGRESDAIATLTELAKRLPNSAIAQMQLARALARQSSTEQQQVALKQWRRIAAKLKPHSENWFEAKYNVALCMKNLNQKSEALKLLEYLKVIPPGWEKSRWKNQFDQLYVDCQN